MAAGTKLILRFGTMSGEKNFTYNNINTSSSAAAIKAAMNTMIANGSIFRYPPMTIISAVAQVVTETVYDLDSD